MSSQAIDVVYTEGRHQLTENGLLLFSAKYGDAGTLKMLLSKKAKFNAKMWKTTGGLLQVAAENGHVDVVEVLLNHRANFNKASKFFNSSSPLHRAARTGHVEVVALLLRRGAAVDAKNKYGRTPLHQTTRYNKPECAKLLLDFRAKVNDNDAYNFTPIHLAARHGCVEIVRMLLIKGADVNSISKREATPLHLAAASGNLEIVKILVSQKAFLDAKNICHKTPLYRAIANDKVETAEFLFNYQSTDINCLLESGQSLLHDKSLRGHVKTISWLLSKGANVDAAGQYGRTPLQFAAIGRSPRAAKVLLSAGASIDAVSDRGNIALHFAAAFESTAVMKLLLRTAGADVNARGQLDHTALHFAADRGNKEVVKILLSSRASVNAASVYANTPLHLATGGLGSPAAVCEIVKLLLAAGADVNATNFDRRTAFDYAIYEDKTVLQQHEVKMMALNVFVNESDVLAIRSDDGMTSFQSKCEEEVALMKSQKIGNGVSFFDILTKPPKQLMMFAKNKDIVRCFKTKDYELIFPLYASDIKNRFVPAIKRANLLGSGRQFFDMFLKGLPRLEYLFTEEILMHLSNGDLQRLRYLVKSEK